MCPKNINMVCGNGKTYTNSCLAKCNGVNAWTQGACETSKPRRGNDEDEDEDRGRGRGQGNNMQKRRQQQGKQQGKQQGTGKKKPQKKKGDKKKRGRD